MKRNGSITTHGREWPLYERRDDDVMVLFMRPEDEAEMERLTEVIKFAWV